MSHEDEWLRGARRVLVNRPKTVGLLPVGAAIDTGAVSLRLAGAMHRLTGELIALFPRWRSWRRDGGVIERAGVVIVHPPAQSDLPGALAELETAVAQARTRFAHILIDLAGMPLRHPATLRCAEALVTVAASGGVREDHLLAVERLLPVERNLGVMLID